MTPKRWSTTDENINFLKLNKNVWNQTYLLFYFSLFICKCPITLRSYVFLAKLRKIIFPQESTSIWVLTSVDPGRPFVSCVFLFFHFFPFVKEEQYVKTLTRQFWPVNSWEPLEVVSTVVSQDLFACFRTVEYIPTI